MPMRLVVVAPSGIICHTQIEMVTLPGEIGAFTVLSGHAPLISHLTAGEIVYTEKENENRLAIKNGFVRVDRDMVEVCVELPDETKKG